MRIFLFYLTFFMIFSVEANDSIVSIVDPRVLEIPIQDDNDPLVDLRDQKVILFGPSPEIPNNTDYFFIRKSVYDKLVEAQAMLPKGIRFCLYEGYRSLALQEKLFKGRYEKVKNIHPEWSHPAIFKETIKLVSPVINLDGSKNVPPHSTGGAIDIYLINDQHNPLPMGIHPKDWMGDLEGKISQTDSSLISKEAQDNRKIMSEVLHKVGFINYAGEYWHWSYGDRYWALHTGSPKAIYGSI